MTELRLSKAVGNYSQGIINGMKVNDDVVGNDSTVHPVIWLSLFLLSLGLSWPLPVPSCELFHNNVNNVGVQNNLQNLIMVTDTCKSDMSRHALIQTLSIIWWNNVYWLYSSAKGHEEKLLQMLLQRSIWFFHVCLSNDIFTHFIGFDQLSGSW